MRLRSQLFMYKKIQQQLEQPLRLRSVLMVFIFLVVIPTILYHLRGYSPLGGDSMEMVGRVSQHWHYFIRAPFVVFLNKILYNILAGFGWEPQEVLALSSSLAGGIYLGGIYRFSNHWRFWVICLLTKTTLIFNGHLENYAWPYALAFWCFVFLKETVEKQSPTWKLWTCMAVATLFHPMVLMIWPGLLYAFYPVSRKVLTEFLIAMIGVFGISNLFYAVMHLEGFFDGGWILPLWGGRMSIFSFEHLVMLFWFYGSTLVPGGVCLFYFGWKEWSGWRGGLILTVGITLLWSLVWNPGMGYPDWDLFAWPSLFVNMAGGVAWLDARSQRLGQPTDQPSDEKVIV